MAFDFAGLLTEIGVQHSIVVQAYAGAGPRGDQYDPPVAESPVYVDERRRLVRAPDGQQVTSSATVFARLDLLAPVGSLVTYGTRTSKVIARADGDGGGADTPDHCELSLE